MIKHLSNNIQNVIQRELFTANTSIRIAVAWFTNDLLFQPLLLKLATGVKVDLILNKDEINLSSSIDFNLFAQQGGNLYWNESSRLMHEKFCIIDDRVVITGSYNWTNRAESNYESISVFTDEQDTIADYQARFQALSRNFVRQTPQVKPQPIANSGKCPMSLQPYTKLKFYHSIRLFKSSNTPILANQYEGGPYALLDNTTFKPRTQFMFSDYSSFVPGRNYLWLRGETKWGLFDCEKLEFVVKPQFDEIGGEWSGGKIVKCNYKYGVVSNSGKILLSCIYDEIIYKTDGVKYPYYILSNNKRYGVYILNNSGDDKLLKCKYDKITYSEPMGYPILHLQFNNSHSVYIFDSKIEVGGDDCNKITFDSKNNYNLLIQHFTNGRFGLYIFNDRVKLTNQYDNITYEESLIYLEKNCKKGVYIVGHKKEFDCIYSRISFNKPFGEGVLILERRLNPFNPSDYTMCNDVYVLDSRMEIGGDWCIDVKYEKPDVSKTRQHHNYTAIVMGTASKKYRVYESYRNRLIKGEYDHISLFSDTIMLDTFRPKLETLYYNIKYGRLETEEEYNRLFEILAKPKDVTTFETLGFANKERRKLIEYIKDRLK